MRQHERREYVTAIFLFDNHFEEGQIGFCGTQYDLNGGSIAAGIVRFGSAIAE